jgi:hypothetical protein
MVSSISQTTFHNSSKEDDNLTTAMRVDQQRSRAWDLFLVFELITEAQKF